MNSRFSKITMAGLALALTACSQTQPSPSAATQQDAEPALNIPVPNLQQAVAETDTTVNTTPPQVIPAGERYLVDAMIGQVNGEPVYANQLLNELDVSLTSIAAQYDGQSFMDQAGRLLVDNLYGHVFNELVYAEAEKQLNEQYRRALSQTLEAYRQEQIRKLGEGSLSATEAWLRETQNITLDQHVQNFRREYVVFHYQNQRFEPLIHVTRRDIERYYHEHEDRFNPGPSWTLRIIQPSQASQASRIRRTLEGGRPFIEMASLGLNTYNHEQGGLREEAVGPNAFTTEELNEAYMQLQPGEWAGPLMNNDQPIFIYVEDVQPGIAITLQDAQEEIRRYLEGNQRADLTMQYQQQLFEEGNYTPIEQMFESLMAIVMARYEGEPWP